jgi:hypothetical protein
MTVQRIAEALASRRTLARRLGTAKIEAPWCYAYAEDPAKEFLNPGGPLITSWVAGKNIASSV